MNKGKINKARKQHRCGTPHRYGRQEAGRCQSGLTLSKRNVFIGAARPPLALKRSAKPPEKISLLSCFLERGRPFFRREHLANILLSCFSGKRRPLFGRGAPGENLAFLLFPGSDDLFFRGLLSPSNLLSNKLSCFPGPLASKPKSRVHLDERVGVTKRCTVPRSCLNHARRDRRCFLYFIASPLALPRLF